RHAPARRRHRPRLRRAPRHRRRGHRRPVALAAPDAPRDAGLLLDLRRHAEFARDEESAGTAEAEAGGGAATSRVICAAVTLVSAMRLYDEFLTLIDSLNP